MLIDWGELSIWVRSKWIQIIIIESRSGFDILHPKRIMMKENLFLKVYIPLSLGRLLIK